MASCVTPNVITEVGARSLVGNLAILCVHATESQPGTEDPGGETDFLDQGVSPLKWKRRAFFSQCK